MSFFCSETDRGSPFHSEPKFLERSTRLCMIQSSGPHRLQPLQFSASSFCLTSCPLNIKHFFPSSEPLYCCSTQLEHPSFIHSHCVPFFSFRFLTNRRLIWKVILTSLCRIIWRQPPPSPPWFSPLYPACCSSVTYVVIWHTYSVSLLTETLFLPGQGLYLCHL